MEQICSKLRIKVWFADILHVLFRFETFAQSNDFFIFYLKSLHSFPKYLKHLFAGFLVGGYYPVGHEGMLFHIARKIRALRFIFCRLNLYVRTVASLIPISSPIALLSFS